MNIKHLVLAASIVVSGTAWATDSAETTLAGKNIQLISTGTPRAYIMGVEIAGCANKTPVLIFDGANRNPLAQEIYSTLLAAKASGKKVVLQANECWSEWSTPVLSSMYILD